jgi:AcrR family transcriptional regulator
MASKDTRTILLNAAEQVVTRDGFSSLTLDTVAKEAGMSKGGLLYHFPGKRELIQAMISHQLDRFDERILVELEKEPHAPGRWLRAYLRAATQVKKNPSFTSGLIAAVATEPDLFDVARERSAKWQKELEADGLDPTTATVIRLAIDGLRYWRIFELSPLSDDAHDLVIQRILDLTETSGSRP